MHIINTIKICFLSLLSLVLVSCASFIDDSKVAYLTKSHVIELPKPSEIKRGESQEALTITYNNKSYNLVVMLQNDGKVLNLIALSDLGIKLFAASYDGDTIELKKYIAIKELPRAQQVLLDIFLSHGSIDVIKKKLPYDLRIYQNALKRKIIDKDGNSIYEIDYIKINSELYPKSLKHLLFNYKIDITKM